MTNVVEKINWWLIMYYLLINIKLIEWKIYNNVKKKKMIRFLDC